MALERVGRYEIQRRLGTGGMGALYLARDPNLDRLVAIKLLRDDFQDDPELRERFLREARSVARLRHQNIVVVHEFGEDDGRPFMAMEYIAGETLARVLKRQPPLPLSRRLSLVEELCAGLAHAHGAGVIHRDIKPSNVMLDGEGVLKILDFGIARLVNSGMTRDGMMMGSVNYMSPEQIVGRGVDQRTDIFATGAVLYEVLAFEQAFPGGHDSGVLNRILYEGPVPLAERVPDVDPELAAIVARALERDPMQRYQEAGELRRDIARVRRRLPDAFDRATLDERHRTVVERASPSAPRRESERPRRLDPARVAELKRQQIEEHLRLGEDAFARHDHEAAIQHAERAATVDPESRAAYDLIDRVRFAVEAKNIRQNLAQAERLLAAGRTEEAAALADQASVTVLDAQGAETLQAEINEIAERIARARERERSISASLERARSSIERGEHETALRAVYEVLAADPESPEAHALEQQAKAGLLARRELERAQNAALERISQAQALADEGRFDDALQAIASVEPRSDTVRTAAAKALADVRRRQEDAARAAIVAAARTAFTEGRLDDAVAALEHLPTDAQDTSARALRSSMDDALRDRRERERKRQALDAMLADASGRLDRGDLTGAHDQLEAAARIGLEDPRIAALERRRAELDAALQEKKRQEARDRVAAKRVEAARQLLAGGDARAALSLLERDESGHPHVAEALREIQGVVAEQEARNRLEAERLQKEEEARRQAEIEAERQRQEQRRIEEARRREEERLRRRQQVVDLLGIADQELAAQRPGEAARILKQAERFGLFKGDEELSTRAEQIGAEAERQTRAQEEARRRDEERRQEELQRQEARRQEELRQAEERRREERRRQEEERNQQEAERQRREEGARLRAEAEAARLREEQRRAEEARQAEEARRREEDARRAAEEARRAEEARLAREAEARRQEEALGRILTDAQDAPEHEAALTILRQAETIAPADPRVLALVRERTLAIEAERRAAEARAAAEAAAREREAQRRRDEAARAAVDEAQRLFAAGQHDAAIALLQAAPAHELTGATLDTLLRQRTALEEERARAERARRRLERRAAATAALRGALADRRLHLAAAALLVVIAGTTAWRFRPAPSDAPAPAPATPSTPVAPAPVNIPQPGPIGAAPAPPPPVIAPAAPPAPGPAAAPPASPARGRGAPGSVVPPPTVAGGRPGGTAATNPPAAPPSTEPSTATAPPATIPQPNASAPSVPAPAAPSPNPASLPSPAPAPPVVATAPPPPPAPAGPNLDAERTAIGQVLAQYVAAYNRMDEGRLREIDPSFRGIPSRLLLRSVTLTPTDLAITVNADGQSATLSATANFVYVANRAGFPPRSTGQLRWTLRKVGGAWTITP